jgi:hypothetical protein
MVEVRIEKEDLKETLKKELEYLNTPLDDDYCLETSQYVTLRVTENGAMIEEVSFWDRFSGPVEKIYTIPLISDVKISGIDLKEVEEKREYIRGSIEIEFIEITPWLAEELYKFLDKTDSEYVHLIITPFSKYHYLLDGERVFKIKRPYF